MKLATFINLKNETVIGAVDVFNQTVLDLQACHIEQQGGKSEFLNDMLALIDSGPSGLNLAQNIEQSNAGTGPNRFNLADVKLLSPVPVPRQIRDFNNAEGHMRNAPAGMAILNAKLKGLPVPKRSDIDVVIQTLTFLNLFFISATALMWLAKMQRLNGHITPNGLITKVNLVFSLGKVGKILQKRMQARIFSATPSSMISLRETSKCVKWKVEWGPPKVKVLIQAIPLVLGSSRPMKSKILANWLLRLESMEKYGVKAQLPQ